MYSMGANCCTDDKHAESASEVLPVNAVGLGLRGGVPDAVLPLKVTIVKVKGMTVTDNGEPSGVPREARFCTCMLMGKPGSKQKTTPRADAAWNQEFEMSDYAAGDSLEFGLYDADSSRKGEALGRAVLSAAQVKAGFSGHLPLLDSASAAYITVKAASGDDYPNMPPEPATVHEDNEFKVTLEKSDSFEPLGIDIVPQSESSLRVKRIKPGLVKEWNDNNADKEILPGQYIVGVNGKRGSAEEILRTIAKGKQLELCLVQVGNSSSR